MNYKFKIDLTSSEITTATSALETAAEIYKEKLKIAYQEEDPAQSSEYLKYLEAKTKSFQDLLKKLSDLKNYKIS